MKIRIYYEDTDAGGIVYHTNYIKYCERARSEVFFEKGIPPSHSDRSGFIVKDIKASFLATARLGDLVEVKGKVLKLKNSSLVLLQEVYNNEVKLFSMEVVLVYVSEGKPVRILPQHRELFEGYF